MNTSFTSIVQLSGIICIGCIAIVRTVMLRPRGVSVIAIDRSRTTLQIASDVLLFSTLLYWLYITIAYCVAPQNVLIPDAMDSIVLDFAVRSWLGIASTILGVVVYGVGVWQMGNSWRIGIDQELNSQLATEGIFRLTRNPIYFGFDFLFVGAFLLHGRLISLVLMVTLILLLHYQILREESFLAMKFGDKFRDYCKTVGRYVTWPTSRQG